MLTKNELNQKKGKLADQSASEGQTDTTESQSRKKRHLLFISIFATVGLSFMFWSYRQLSAIMQSPIPSFNLPSISIPSTPTSLDSIVDSILKNDVNKWNVSVYDGQVFNWPQNTNNFDYESVLKSLNAQKKSSFIIRDYLPQGLTIYEQYSELPSGLSLKALVVTPKKDILLVISSQGHDIASAKALLPKLVSDLYWSLIKD
jgi:hypothetical protein